MKHTIPLGGFCVTNQITRFVPYVTLYRKILVKSKRMTTFSYSIQYRLLKLILNEHKTFELAVKVFFSYQTQKNEQSFSR